ncbi:sensor histidine kinase [Cytobacillus dafuensis]|uniref:histidine kinase n=1 Tax=Cytobacillus dafuensis TaxID=1742359 RepID=A0A5B8Z0R8_CYTDA|nr:sensor histidine kinase [Cytobacillus dafuensis]QED46530.1 HAMP domain-containing histidine kinase [Cytobacillus dafuensis]
MTILGYLQSQKWLILMFVVLMSFFTLVTLIDPIMQIHISSLLYIEGVAVIIFALYCGFDYYRKKSFFNKLKRISEIDEYIPFSDSMIDSENMYVQLMKIQQEKHIKKLERMELERKEWQEYMTSWFHEVKTPIAVSRMIYETGGSLESLAEEMDKVEHFIEQALYFSRISDFHKDYFIQEIDLERIVKEAVKMHTKTFIAKRISINLDMQKFEVLTDKKGILFILNQLLSNSLKYTECKGSISIHIDCQKRTLRIRDSGIGIAQEDLPRVFEKGFTGKNGRQHVSSTGMGLYLAKKTAEKLGHTLTLSSEKDKFTEAIISFPNTEDRLYIMEQ